MRKQVFGRKFKRDKNERKALFKGLISAMILKGKIETTEEKAKAIKPDIEKLVTKAKKKDAKRLLQSDLKPFEIDKMINVIAPGFKNRKGGYTRIIKNGVRFSDKASMAVIEWVEMEAVEVKPEAKEEVKKKTVKTEKKVAKKETKSKKESSSKSK